jgi:hypothetical protein
MQKALLVRNRRKELALCGDCVTTIVEFFSPLRNGIYIGN